MEFKGFNKFLNGERHFMVATEDGTGSGRWEGPSYVLDSSIKLKDEDTIILECDDSVWINRKGQQNVRQKLNFVKENKVYFQQNMDRRTKLMQNLSTGVSVAGLAVAIIALPLGV